MAILIEEEKKKTNWGVMMGLAAVLIIVGSAIYYLFFVNPEKVELILNSQQKNLSSLDKVEFKPEQLLNNESFKALQSSAQLSLPSSTGFVGKANPFLP